MRLVQLCACVRVSVWRPVSLHAFLSALPGACVRVNDEHVLGSMTGCARLYKAEAATCQPAWPTFSPGIDLFVYSFQRHVCHLDNTSGTRCRPPLVARGGNCSRCPGASRQPGNHNKTKHESASWWVGPRQLVWSRGSDRRCVWTASLALTPTHTHQFHSRVLLSKWHAFRQLVNMKKKKKIFFDAENILLISIRIVKRNSSY